MFTLMLMVKVKRSTGIIRPLLLSGLATKVATKIPPMMHRSRHRRSVSSQYSYKYKSPVS